MWILRELCSRREDRGDGVLSITKEQQRDSVTGVNRAKSRLKEDEVSEVENDRSQRVL